MGIKWEITDSNKSQGLSWEIMFMDPGVLSSVRQSEVLAVLKNEVALTEITKVDFLQS